MSDPPPDPPDLVSAARQELDQTGVLPAQRGAPGEAPGDTVDRYKLLEEIGEGGMGTVWMAQQLEPIKRKVALKVIKLGMDTREVVVRFEAERQALALMDHPHIARVLDGGATEAGRPFFVMELVRGIPITEYSDKARLGLRERLELFTKVCEAIQHAHQKGVIHRDIKPSNVLVTLHDGVPIPKVIDFGIAKATSAELTQKTLFTKHAQIIGTPEYMAPEQAELSGLDIDTRADVYALGALLYEMLTGSKLFDIHTVLGAGYDELLRTIREVEPQRPSTRISTLGEAASPIAANRHVNVESLRKRLSGDLDWVVMKALEKDRTRRYETASSFADDVMRFLRQEPVAAAPPGVLYRLRKFVHRRRKTVVALATIALLVIAGSVGTGVGWWESIKANRELAIALNDKNDALARETQQRERALRELGRSTEVKRLLTEMLASVDPQVAQLNDTVLLRGILDDSARRLAAGEVEDEHIAAELRAIIGAVYGSLGQVSEAERHLVAATEAFERLLDRDDPTARSARTELGRVYARLDRFGEAEALFTEQLDSARRLGDEPATGRALSDLGDVLTSMGHLERAESRKREAVEVLGLVHGEQHPTTLTAKANLGVHLTAMGRFDESETRLRKVLELQRRALGEEHLDTVRTKHNLAYLLQVLARFDEAEALYLEVLRVSTQALDPSHPERLKTQANLARTYADQHRDDEAESMLLEVLRAQEATLGPDHTETLISKVSLAVFYSDRSRFDEAAQTYRQVLDVQRRVLGDEHRNTLMTKNNLALTTFEMGRIDEAERLCSEVLADRRRTLDPDHWDIFHSMILMARVHSAQGHREKAEALFLETLDRRTRVLGREHPEVVETMGFLGIHYLAQGQQDEAEAMFREVLEIRRRTQGDDDPDTLGVMGRLALLLFRQGRYEEAEPLMREVLDSRRRVLGNEHPDTLGGATNLGLLYNSTGRYPQAKEVFESVLPDMKRALGPDHAFVGNTLQGLAVANVRLGNGEEAERLFRELHELRKRTLGPEAPDTLRSLRNLILLLTEQRRFPEALELSAESLALHQRVFGDQHMQTLIALVGHPDLLASDDRFDEAEERYLEALDTLHQATGPDSRLTLGTTTNLGYMYNRMARFEEAAELLEPCLARMRTSLAPEDPFTFEAVRALAEAYAGSGRVDEGLPLQREWLTRQLELAGGSNPAALDAASTALLNSDYEDLFDPERARDLARQACDLEEKQGGQQRWKYLATLAEAQYRTGAPAAAIETQTRALDLVPGKPDAEMMKRLEEYERGQ